MCDKDLKSVNHVEIKLISHCMHTVNNCSIRWNGSDLMKLECDIQLIVCALVVNK